MHRTTTQRLLNPPHHQRCKEPPKSLGTILLILLLVDAIPTWSHSHGWGYMPSGALGLIVIILIVLLAARPDMNPALLGAPAHRLPASGLPRCFSRYRPQPMAA
ncbi:DUF3309 domain-containing protein [Metapseudomonas furukawaii]